MTTSANADKLTSDNPPREPRVHEATVTALAGLGSSVVRLVATVPGDVDRDGWSAPNAAFRLEVPASGADEMVTRVYTVRAAAQRGELEEITIDSSVTATPAGHAVAGRRWPGDSSEVVGASATSVPEPRRRTSRSSVRR